MKKTVLLLTAFLCVFIICACAHEHEEAEEYKNDENFHWFPCTDEDCDVTYNKVKHTWGVGEITTKPTSAQDGVMSYLCTVCKRLKQEPVKYNPNPVVSHSQWQSAFVLTKFDNVAATLTEVIEHEGAINKWEYSIQANPDAIYMTMITYVDGEEKQYYGKYQEGRNFWIFTDRNQKKEDVIPTNNGDIMTPTMVLTNNGFDKLKDMFDSFSYNENTGYYEAENVVIESTKYEYKKVAVKMADGKILEIKAVTTNNPPIDITISYYDYGAAKPIPPMREDKK